MLDTDEASSCTGKVPYTTKTDAILAVQHGVRGNWYLCKHCGLFHIGVGLGRDKKKIDEKIRARKRTKM